MLSDQASGLWSCLCAGRASLYIERRSGRIPHTITQKERKKEIQRRKGRKDAEVVPSYTKATNFASEQSVAKSSNTKPGHDQTISKLFFFAKTREHYILQCNLRPPARRISRWADRTPSPRRVAYYTPGGGHTRTRPGSRDAFVRRFGLAIDRVSASGFSFQLHLVFRSPCRSWQWLGDVV